MTQSDYWTKVGATVVVTLGLLLATGVGASQAAVRSGNSQSLSAGSATHRPTAADHSTAHHRQVPVRRTSPSTS